MQEDEYGFVYPKIDDTKCIHCGLCEQVCERIKNINKKEYQKAYALQGKDYELINTEFNSINDGVMKLWK